MNFNRTFAYICQSIASSSCRDISIIVYPFNRVFYMTADSMSDDNFTSLTGQTITTRNDSKRKHEQQRNDYPLRAELEQLTILVWGLLERNERAYEDVRRAALILRETIWDYLDELAQYQDEDDSDESDGEFLAHVENSNIDIEDFATESEGDAEPTLRHWWVYSDVHSIIESLEESWLESKSWKAKRAWTFTEIYMVLSLWGIDESVWYLNRGEMGKAASWAMRAQLYYGFALSATWSANDEIRIRADLARKAADSRHAETRAIKSDVFAWCAENLGTKTIDGAAEEIAGKVFNIKFRTAQKYISEYRKSVQSARTA
ncbi:hypothetical protein [Paraburkholderia domus]|uniref:hypothetical protein n=1 Tax=Paraburkholderia domus TaxID=2793075 RepID=UPI001B12F99A|nr:hypothetical protein [Paraburkholderia domus]CAE6851163.1 hypothetical protein R75483_07603 [Paraburkholderia domus]